MCCRSSPPLPPMAHPNPARLAKYFPRHTEPPALPYTSGRQQLGVQHPSDTVPAPAGTEGTTWNPCPPPPCTHTSLIPAQTQHKPGRAGLIGRQRGLSSSQRRISPDLGLETQFHFICHASASAHNRAKPVTCQVGFAARSPDGAAQAPAAPLHPRGGDVQEPPPGDPQ